MTAAEIFHGSDGAATKAYYAHLETFGPIGLIALNLIRSQKNSTRAKAYRGGIRGIGSYRSMAYDRKNWSLGELVKVLEQHGASLGITYGWKEDFHAFANAQVIYIDIPQGQVSFHSPHRMQGPDYPGDWDRQHKSEERILAFCDSLRHVDARQLTLDNLTTPTGESEPEGQDCSKTETVR